MVPADSQRDNREELYAITVVPVSGPWWLEWKPLQQEDFNQARHHCQTEWSALVPQCCLPCPVQPTSYVSAITVYQWWSHRCWGNAFVLLCTAFVACSWSLLMSGMREQVEGHRNDSTVTSVTLSRVAPDEWGCCSKLCLLCQVKTVNQVDKNSSRCWIWLSYLEVESVLRNTTAVGSLPCCRMTL